MKPPSDPDDSVPPSPQPTRDLLLAQALDACIAAERRRPGSAHRIIARQPAWARADLQQLVDLVRSLDAAAAEAAMSNAVRAATRRRLLRRIGGYAASYQRSAPPGVTPLTRLESEPDQVAARKRKTFWVGPTPG